VHVTRLLLRDFRSYAEAQLELSPGTTTLLGRNGNGKTNLVEGLAYLSTLSSHRVATDAPLVRFGAGSAAVGATVQRGSRTVSLQVQINPGRSNRAWVNRSPVPRPRDILGTLRTVVFAPEDLSLVKGDPSMRRRYLDDLMTLRLPRLAGTRADYERVVRQRTALLRSLARPGGPSRRADRPPDVDAEHTLDVWDDQMVSHGAELLHARQQLVHELVDAVGEAYAAVAPEAGDTALRYSSSVREQDVSQPEREGETPGSVQEWADIFRDALASARASELERGLCLVGPHRDDLALSLRDLPARGYASQGESWSYALALRLASFALLQDIDDGGAAVLVLDDVMAELDDRRRHSLAHAVAEADQVLVTAAVAADVPDELTGTAIHVPEEVISDPAS
jgi:DNA replication and repair protein RecF